MNQKLAELQKNELSEWVEKKFGSLKPYVGTILLATLALILVAIVFGYWLGAMRDSKSEPWRDLQIALATHMTDGQTSHFDLVTERHPNTLASLWAQQMAGDADLRFGLSKLVAERDAGLKQIDRARKSLEKIQESTLKKPDLLKERSLYSLGYAYESMGEFDKAKNIYTRLTTELPDAPMSGQAQAALARLDNPAILAAFAKFKTVGTAPGMRLPPIPDISFPEDTAPTPTDSNDG
jgi:tetratricopeptide (TPR) repeat protein